jgi:hypothetical protein
LALTLLLVAPALASEATTAAKTTAPPSIDSASRPAPSPERPLEEIDSLDRDGFSGLLIVSSDTDWQQRWDVPGDDMPDFNTTGSVKRGDKVVVLAFAGDAQPGADGNVDVRCEIAVRGPDGRIVAGQADAVCLAGAPHHIVMTQVQVEFLAEDADPRGAYLVEYVLHDRVRGVSLPLRVKFTYE